MDPRFAFRKGYDTDLLILRSLFALNPATNLPISSSYLLTTDGVGGLEWESAIQLLSTAIGVPNLASTLNTFSTNISTNTGFITSYSTNFLTRGISTLSLSSGQITTSTLALFDLVNNSQQILTASNGQLYINGNAIVPGSGVTQGQLVSTTAGLGTAGYVSTTGLNRALASTVSGLGNAGYVSTPSLVSTVIGLGSAGYVSTATLNALSNYVFDPIRYISTGNLFSTTESLLSYVTAFNPVGNDISSFVVYGTANFYSTLSIGIFNLYIQDVSTLSTAVGIELDSISTTLGINYYGWATSSQLISSIIGIGGTGIVSSGQLVSSIEGLGTYGYISSPQLGSTTAGLVNNLFPPYFTSTVIGLGSAGYVSSSQLNSTVRGLGTVGYISSSQLVSTVIGLGSAGYISTASLVSTVVGLETTKGPLVSTVAGLGTIGYISSSQLQSTVIGLGGTGVISTGQLVSTIEGLGTYGYVSTASLLSANQYFFSTGNYISTGNLVSTTRGLLGSFTIVNSGDIYITNGTVNVTNANDITYLSSFLYSTITYKGNNGSFTASNNDAILYFSTANLQLDQFSSYITSRSMISIEVIPTILFDKLAYTLNDWTAAPAKVPQQIYMSSFVQFGPKNYFSSQMSETMMFPLAYDSNTSNMFNQPIKINLTGNLVTSVYNQRPFTLSHYLPNGRSLGNNNGFSNSNITCFFGSTNSLFLSIQNLP
jgi:hypothetical protein